MPSQTTEVQAVPQLDTTGKTLSDIEQEVHSPHVDAGATVPSPVAETTVEDARNAVEAALKAATSSVPEPITALNAQPLGPELHEQPTYQPAPGFGTQAPVVPTKTDGVVDETLDMPLPAQPTVTPPPASAFPGSMPQQPQDNTLPPPPPVPPPPIFPS